VVVEADKVQLIDASKTGTVKQLVEIK